MSSSKCYTVPFQQHCGMKRKNINPLKHLDKIFCVHECISNLTSPLHHCCCVPPTFWLSSSLSFSSHPPSSSCPCRAGCRPSRPDHAVRRPGPASSSRPVGPESDRGTGHMTIGQENDIQMRKANEMLIMLTNG